MADILRALFGATQVLIQVGAKTSKTGVLYKWTARAHTLAPLSSGEHAIREIALTKIQKQALIADARQMLQAETSTEADSTRQIAITIDKADSGNSCTIDRSLVGLKVVDAEAYLSFQSTCLEIYRLKMEAGNRDRYWLRHFWRANKRNPSALGALLLFTGAIVIFLLGMLVKLL